MHLQALERARSRAFTLVELLVVIAIIATLVGLLLPAVQQIRVAAARTACANNSHQIALGFHNYYSDHGWFPPAYNGVELNPGWGWVTFLLPYLEQQSIYQALSPNTTVFGGGGVAATPTTLTQTRLDVFLCPADLGSGILNSQKRNFGKSNYRGIFGPYVNNAFYANFDYGGVLMQNSQMTIAQITDGTSNTLIVGECVVDPLLDPSNPTGHSGAIWVGMDLDSTSIWISDVMWGMDADTFVLNGSGIQAYGSRHPIGANFIFCDGSVRYINNSVNSQVMIDLCGRNDGSIVSSGAY